MAKEQVRDKPTRKKGFNVGPANLPDGTYRRKVVKIKKSLIHKAKVKKAFSKVVANDKPSTGVHAAQANKYLEEAAAQKKREDKERARLRKVVKDSGEKGEDAGPEAPKMHPQRQAALEAPPMEEVEDLQGNHRQRRPPKKPKTSSFRREEEYAAKIQAEREAATKEAEQMRKVHEQKERERQRRKKVMSARTGRGQQKLGKQGSILLDKVKAIMGKS